MACPRPISNGMYNPERVTYFAATDSRGKRVPFGIKAKDRDRHMYVVGKTGMGKSTLLENMAIQDIQNGEGLAFLDPHGSAIDNLLDYIPEDRIKDVVYFAPFDMDHPIAFNVMEDVGYDKRHLVVSGLMATFKKIWQDAWSARMEYILTNTLLALLEYPDATLLGVNRMYTDKEFRTKVVDNVKDPVVKDFWVKEFANYGDRYTQEATPAIQNKIGQFTGNPLIRNIIGQPKSSFDIRDMMDRRKILLINLSKGLVGETNMRLLGSMLTTRIFLAAMSRAGSTSAQMEKLPHFYFYVDEFQNFANETFAEILSESRKYKLDLIITHQYIEQMEEEVRDAVFGNVGTTVSFRVGPFDAEVLETVFMPKFTKEDIVSLDKRQIYLSLMIDGVGSAPFSAVTIPPIEKPPVSHKATIIESSRASFSTPREKIESAIVEELMKSVEAEAPQDARMRKVQYAKQAKEARATESASNQSMLRRGPDRRDTHPAEYSRPAPTARIEEPRASHPMSHMPDRRQMQRRETPPQTPEDLKALLRSMTQKVTTEKETKHEEQHQSLKGALSEVLKQQPEQAKAPTPEPVPAPVASTPSAPAPRTEAPVAAPPKREDVPTPTPPPAEEKRPFEIPEAELRKVLRGES